MYRTLTDPAYHKSNNPHGRRLNPRKGSTPMHLMATFALQKLPNNEGNLSQIGDLITSNEFFSKVGTLQRLGYPVFVQCHHPKC